MGRPFWFSGRLSAKLLRPVLVLGVILLLLGLLQLGRDQAKQSRFQEGREQAATLAGQIELVPTPPASVEPGAAARIAADKAVNDLCGSAGGSGSGARNIMADQVAELTYEGRAFHELLILVGNAPKVDQRQPGEAR